MTQKISVQVDPKLTGEQLEQLKLTTKAAASALGSYLHSVNMQQPFDSLKVKNYRETTRQRAEAAIKRLTDELTQLGIIDGEEGEA